MKRYECTGCGACYNACTNGCIVMKKAFDGCYYPAINREECISCGKCIKVCPVRNASENNKEYKISDVYVGHSKDALPVLLVEYFLWRLTGLFRKVVLCLERVFRKVKLFM